MTVLLSGSTSIIPCTLQVQRYLRQWANASTVSILQYHGTPTNRLVAYFVSLGLAREEAAELHHRYYTQYGLALRGLTRHHAVGNSIPHHPSLQVNHDRGIDPLEFDRLCDGSLPLEEMIKFDPELVKLFEDIDRTKARVWALTNAYKPVSFTRVFMTFFSLPSTPNVSYVFLNSRISSKDWSTATMK